MEIINAGREDEGMYTCQASNRAGSDSASVVWFFTGRFFYSVSCLVKVCSLQALDETKELIYKIYKLSCCCYIFENCDFIFSFFFMDKHIFVMSFVV